MMFRQVQRQPASRHLDVCRRVLLEMVLPVDRETEELLNWWRGELVARERTAERSKPATKVSAGSSNRRLGSNSDRGAKTPKV